MVGGVGLNVLLSSAGRRVSLVKAFQRATHGRDHGLVYAGDVDSTAPALLAADGAVTLPSVLATTYIDELLTFCKQCDVTLVVPLIDPELPILSAATGILAQHGITVAVSRLETVTACRDKYETSRVFAAAGVDSPTTFEGTVAREAVKSGQLRLPVIVKPRQGSAGRGVTRCDDWDALDFGLRDPYAVIVQEMLTGIEVTVDVFGDGTGSVLSAVPRKRLKTRAGEVERGVTVDDAPFICDIRRISEVLRPYGPINIQCFVTHRGVVYTEVNPRFGGGYPLADAAGARFPELLLDLVSGRVPVGSSLYSRGIVMTRYDEAFYVGASAFANGEELCSLSPTTRQRPEGDNS